MASPQVPVRSLKPLNEHDVKLAELRLKYQRFQQSRQLVLKQRQETISKKTGEKPLKRPNVLLEKAHGRVVNQTYDPKTDSRTLSQFMDDKRQGEAILIRVQAYLNEKTHLLHYRLRGCSTMRKDPELEQMPLIQRVAYLCNMRQRTYGPMPRTMLIRLVFQLCGDVQTIGAATRQVLTAIDMRLIEYQRLNEPAQQAYDELMSMLLKEEE